MAHPQAPQIPPPGEIRTPGQKAAVVSFVDSLVYESTERRRDFEWMADTNLRLYLGDHWFGRGLPDGMARVTVNRIQNAVLAGAAVLTQSRPEFTFAARESQDRPIYYINLQGVQRTPAVIEFLAQFPLEATVETVDPNSETDPPTMRPPRALTDDEATTVQTAIFSGLQISQAVDAQQAPPTALENVIPASILAKVNNEKVAEAYKVFFDAKWDEANGDYYVAENILNNLVIGWQNMLCEWNDEEQQLMLRNPEFLMIHVDPTQTDISTAQFGIYDQLLSKDQAITLYPHLEDEIKQYAMPGTPQQPGEYGYRRAWPYQQLVFRRDMIIVRSAWLRSQMYPMSIQEALTRGKVTIQNKASDVPPSSDTPEDVLADAESTPYYMLPNGAEVSPGDSDWPKRPGVRLLQVIANTVVYDEEYPLGDIPLPQNVNIPMPGSPYGQGEPQRLEGLQKAANAILSDLVTFYNHNAMPLQWVAESVQSRLPEMVADAYINAGTKMVVPDDLLLAMQGKLVGFIEPPQMPTDAWKLVELLLQLIDTESNHSEVMQGRAKAGWSGDAIQSLQQAATGVLGFKSRRTETMLKYLATLITRALVHRTTSAEWQKYVSQYSPHILDAIRERLKSLTINIRVEITGNKDAHRAANKQMIIQEKQAGLLSPQTAQRELGHDPVVEEQNMKEFARMMQANPQTANQLAPPMPQSQPIKQ